MRLPREDKILGKAQLRSNWLRKLWFQMQRAAEGRTNSDAIVRHVSWQNVSLPSWSLNILTNQISRAVEKTLPSLADSLRTIRLNRLRDGRVMEFIHAACLELSRATKQRSDFETVFDSMSQSGAIIDLSSSSSWKKQEWKWSRASGILIRLVPSSSTPLDKSVSSDSSQDVVTALPSSGLEFRAYNIASEPANKFVTFLDKHLFWQHCRSHLAVRSISHSR